jgi:L-seryl-tRNA(Ser) seleniumtransferase
MGSIRERYGLEKLINATGYPTIVGANVCAPEVIEAVSEVLALNLEIDQLQRAASRVIVRVTGAEAGCVTSSCSSAIAIGVAAAMTGADFGRIVQLPETTGMADEVILQKAHNVNFGGEIGQMVRLTGARLVEIGAGNHCDLFHLSAALGAQTAAILYVVSGAVHPEAHLLSLEQCVGRGVPVIVDAAAQPEVRSFLRAGADLVVASGHKAPGAPTSGLICGRKDLVRACYLQNWGIGRAMKVGKEGIVGLMAALELWAARDPDAEKRRLDRLAELLAAKLSGLTVVRGLAPYRVDVHLHEMPAQSVANVLREGGIWVRDAFGSTLALDLRRLNEQEVQVMADRIREAVENRLQPKEDVPYHDLYRSRERLLRWPEL